jgi:hypothetical protein
MNRYETDPTFTPTAVRLAQPLVNRFVESVHCPPAHRWHARTTLAVLALYVAISTEPAGDSLGWGDLDADELMSASLDCDADDAVFLRDLLDASASFYAFLAAEKLVPRERAYAIRSRLATLALGLRGA